MRVRKSYLVFVLLFACTVLGQEGVIYSRQPSTSKHVPGAIELLKSLRASNGLEGLSETPWHAVLSYDQFDEDGDNVHSGTIEEYFASPKKYRKVIQTDEFVQTEVADGSELYRVGEQIWPTSAILHAEREILAPLHLSSRVDRGDVLPDTMKWNFGKVTLPCVVLKNKQFTVSDNGLMKFYYEETSKLLRYTRGLGWDETVYNEIVQFRQRFLARDVAVTHSEKPYLKIHLEKVESLSQVDGTLFSPPAGSPGPITRVTGLPSNVLMEEYLMSKPVTTFPRGVKGKVTVKFVVGKDGHVIHTEASEAPEDLRKAACENTMKFEFRPFLILDKPAEVEASMFYQIQ